MLARDGLVCWLCGDEMWLGAPENHPLAFSLDHVVPSAFGGGDEIENLKGAHRVCNSARLSRKQDHQRLRRSGGYGSDA